MLKFDHPSLTFEKLFMVPNSFYLMLFCLFVPLVYVWRQDVFSQFLISLLSFLNERLPFKFCLKFPKIFEFENAKSDFYDEWSIDFPLRTLRGALTPR